MRKLFLILVVMMMLSGTAHALTWSNYADWNGTDAISSFGEDDTATYGQTFSTTDAILLNSVSFWVDDHLNSDFVDFQLVVGTWTGTAVGSVLWQSPEITTTNNGGQDGWEEITVNLGGLALAGGSDFYMFMSASNFFDGIEGTCDVAGTFADTADGQFLFKNNGSDFDAVFSGGYSSWSPQDMVFSANYDLADPSAVPEPSTVALLLAGFAGLIGFSIKRRS